MQGQCILRMNGHFLRDENWPEKTLYLSLSDSFHFCLSGLLNHQRTFSKIASTKPLSSSSASPAASPERRRTHTFARAWPLSLSSLSINQSKRPTAMLDCCCRRRRISQSLAHASVTSACEKHRVTAGDTRDPTNTHTHADRATRISATRSLQHVSWLTYFENTFTELATRKHAHLGSRTLTHWVNVPAGGVTHCVSQKKKA